MAENNLVVKEMFREQRVSSKSGKTYYVLVQVFSNGYIFESFLTNEQNYILASVPLR